ncbi:ABC transporter permease [Pseudomonas typographi]|uniref:ABC transporter permease n=1 Tax=Pseudomonas typographi TaxID=2715964 RepID=A0ABR7YX34_9PSED|nr:ABC transporter permease [Pseudomonas typographi]MBD1597711.1 ABC transporter permease [Pseudomonas typographi]
MNLPWRSIPLWLGALCLLAIGVAALAAPVLVGSDPLAMVARPYLWPGQNAAHWLGTDMLGRDLWSGLVYGARVSLRIGLEAGVCTALLGLAIGCLAGYFGGWVDNLLMRVTELFQIMPSLIFTLVLVIILGPRVDTLVLGIAATAWPNVARLARGEAQRLAGMEFVQAARVIGMSEARILWVHILPNALMPVLAMLAMLVGHAILTEAALAFLGLSDPNVVSWGSMIGAGRDVLRTAWYMTALPGLAIFFTVAALGLLGGALNDWLNPRRGGLQ